MDSPSLTHNIGLAKELARKLKVHSRYPRVSEQAECLPLDSFALPVCAYNPSVIAYEERLLMTYRYHYAGDYRTHIGIAEIHDGGKVRKPTPLVTGEGSYEDARLFQFHGEVWMSWVESNFIGQKDPKSVVKYAQVEPGFKLGRIYQPEAGGNDWSSMQKNWGFFESDENLFCLFESWPEQIVFQVQGDKIINEYRSKPVVWPYGAIRGGAFAPHEDMMLRFFHSSTDKGVDAVEKRYYAGYALMESKPPFATIAASKRPILYGSEVDQLKGVERRACRPWKANVVFPCGAMPFEGGYLLACGINDAACSLVKITKEMLQL